MHPIDTPRPRAGRRKLLKRRRAVGVAVAAALAVSSSAAFAVENVWTGAIDNNYNNPGNWSLNRVPTNANGNTPPAETFDDAVINTSTGNIATISADIAATPRDILVGGGAGTNGLVNHTAGTARTGAGNWMFVGRDGGTGRYDVTGSGSLDVSDRLYVAGHFGAPATGTLNINTTGTVKAGGDLNLGAANGTGTVNLTAGAVSVGAWLSIGRDENGTDGTGNFNQSGGTVAVNLNTIVALPGTTGNYTMTGGTNTTNGELWVGNGRDAAGPAVGTMTVNAGSVTVNNWVAVGRDGATGTLNVGGTGAVREIGAGDTHFTIGTGGLGNGTVNVSGGGIVETNGDLLVAENNPTARGTVNQTGGTVLVGRNLEVQRNGTGTYSLSGGTLSVNGFIDTADGTFNFTGGKITRGGTGLITINGPLVFGGSAATLDVGAGKTFDVNGTLNIASGVGLDLTGREIPAYDGSGTDTGSIALGLVDGINGQFTAPTLIGFNSRGATLISEAAGEGGTFNSATQSVFWLQESGGAVTLQYSVVPEPATAGVFALSGLALLARRRRKA